MAVLVSDSSRVCDHSSVTLLTRQTIVLCSVVPSFYLA